MLSLRVTHRAAAFSFQKCKINERFMATKEFLTRVPANENTEEETNLLLRRRWLRNKKDTERTPCRQNYSQFYGGPCTRRAIRKGGTWTKSKRKLGVSLEWCKTQKPYFFCHARLWLVTRNFLFESAFVVVWSRWCWIVLSPQTCQSRRLKCK